MEKQMSLTIGVLKETVSGETRVALTPEIAKKFISLNTNVIMERGAGELSNQIDGDYDGVEFTDRNEVLKKCDLLLTVQPISPEDSDELNQSSYVVGMVFGHLNKETVQSLLNNNHTSFAMELMPRISRAQSMDVLSSQSNLSGYKAVVDAASFYNKAFPLMMTSAGTIPPAKVLVIGAGVAGLQAIATAKRLGAVVFAFDVRSATKEQVESLGGNFVSVPDDSGGETSGGYAKEMTKNYKAKQAKLLEETLSKIDVVISTALIPGKPAPKIITKKMIDKMKSGSVVYDLASEFGGNCELTKHGEHVEYKSKFIVGPNNLASTVSQDASRLFSKNILNFLNNSADNGKFNDFNWDDELVIGTCLLKNGKQNISKG